MGSDGAIKLKRKELVQTKTTPTITKNETKEYTLQGKFKHCYLSQKKLSTPLVSDYMGRLYNKESILEFLIDPSKFTVAQKESVKHIKSLKDLIELNIKQKSDGEQLICTITGESLGSSKSRAVYLVGCGDTFIEKCLQFDDSSKCPVCQAVYSNIDIITLNPTDEIICNLLQERMDSLRNQGLTHSLKKIKSLKRKKEKNSSGEVSDDKATKKNKP